jgi:hypothetical protein
VTCPAVAVDSTDLGVSATLYGVAFSGTEGLAVGSSQTLLHYSGGAWSEATAPDDDYAYHLYGVDLGEDGDGWAVGYWTAPYGGYQYGMALRLVDGTWTSFLDSMGWSLYAVAVDANGDGWGVGSKGQLTRLSGGSYSPTFGGNSTALYGVDVIDKDTGWAVGASAELMKLSGGSWTHVAAPASFYSTLYAVALSDADNGWAVGEYGSILRLQNGVWSVEPAITNQTLRAVTIAADGSVWAFGSGGVVLRRGGAVWEQCVHDDPATGSIYGAEAAGAGLWLVGTSGLRAELAP